MRWTGSKPPLLHTSGENEPTRHRDRDDPATHLVQDPHRNTEACSDIIHRSCFPISARGVMHCRPRGTGRDVAGEEAPLPRDHVCKTREARDPAGFPSP